ncbi:MAG: nuclear transport factor 2 family protein [Actinomycetota bacterium]|jgi:ketosteroid isomerase-like protein|nr:nuclear transport factor 2 family protein [Actinomycetota bacterium]
MSDELGKITSDFVAALDALDVERIMQLATDDVQGVDEISRRWLRGREEVEAYLRQLMASVSAIRTELREPTERVWGDCGVLTCWIDQEYTMEGEPQHVSAPTTIVCRREAGDWKWALFHSIPIPA